MKITDWNGVQDTRLTGAAAPPDPAATRLGTAGATAGGGDEVQVSDTARLISQLARVNVDEVRQDRVIALRQAIATGSYQVEPQTVARAFLTDLAGELLG